MYLQEQFTALKAEKDQYLKIIENQCASITALDLMYREAIQSNHKSKTDLLIANNDLQKLNRENSALKKELSDIKVERDNFKNIVENSSSTAQAIES